jgi:hypothetical protein
MTQDDVCALIVSLGGKEYRHPIGGPGARHFQMARLLDVPDCTCNDKAPGIHVGVYPDHTPPGQTRTYDGTVEFEIVGEAGDGRWLKAHIYSVKREEVAEIYPDIERTARGIWMAFVEGLAHRVGREVGHE